MSKNPFKQNKWEICYHLINALIAGVLVMLGSFASGNIRWESFALALFAALVVAITKFKDYWDGEAGEYTKKVFNFL